MFNGTRIIHVYNIQILISEACEHDEAAYSKSHMKKREKNNKYIAIKIYFVS